MSKLVVCAGILSLGLCASANAKPPFVYENLTGEERGKAAACWAAVDQESKAAWDARTIDDQNGPEKPRVPPDGARAAFIEASKNRVAQCKDWINYVRQNYDIPPGN